jgi:Glycosyl transferase family 11
MIAVEARGRLGNHMFQYAFGLAAARRIGTDFVMDEELLREHFVLAPRGGTLHRARRALWYRVRRRRSPLPVVKVTGDADPDRVMESLRDSQQYAGFFQSERYFLDAAADVADAFRPRPEHDRRFAERYSSLVARGYVCCNVRKTDYREWGGGVALPISYYEESLRRAKPAEGTPIVFVGDDLTEARSTFTGGAFRFEQNEEGIDLLLLSRASLAIISNSSFGWWGAWLGGEGRRVFAPRHWLGFRHGAEVPRAVVPVRWLQVPVAPG